MSEQSRPGNRPADCDSPSAPTVVDGKCRCIVCAHCKHHTGNSYTGHYTTWCHVINRLDTGHFCCPDKCELDDATTLQANVNRLRVELDTAERKLRHARGTSNHGRR